MNSSLALRVLFISLLWFSSSTFATTPLFDRVEVGGQQGNLHHKEKGWLTERAPRSMMLANKPNPAAEWTLRLSNRSRSLTRWAFPSNFTRRVM